MADWAKPTLTSTYTNFLAELSGRLDDAGKLSRSDTVTLTNPPVGTIRWNTTSAKWQTNTGTVAVPVWSDLTATYAIAISGNAGTATTLATARTINSVSFNGSANILVNTNNAATFNNGGAGAASGSTFNGSAALTISYNTVGAPSATGTGASGNWGISITGNAATATSATSATTATTAGNVSGTVAIANGGTASTTAAAALVALGQQTGLTGAALTPTGTTAQRPTPATGHFRFNTTTVQFEGYNGTAWGAVGGGATGGGTDQVFVENGQTVNTNYTITSGKNAMSAGPITIASGITVTVPSGSNWVIV